MWKRASRIATALLFAAPLALADGSLVPERVLPASPLSNCYEAAAASVAAPKPEAEPDPLLKRLVTYTQFSLQHRVSGLASYYSGFFDGRRTANGEVYRNRKYSAAHLTLPLGTWIEVRSRATGRKLRMRVNDRGPYTKKFCLDLSQAAARFLGVDTAEDRYVDIRIIALPGERPLPEDLDLKTLDAQLADLAQKKVDTPLPSGAGATTVVSKQ